jgi:hypothetical protein
LFSFIENLISGPHKGVTPGAERGFTEFTPIIITLDVKCAESGGDLKGRIAA